MCVSVFVHLITTMEGTLEEQYLTPKEKLLSTNNTHFIEISAKVTL